MNKFFNELPWHDSNLKSIVIDRNNPGEHDIVRILVEWSDTGKSSILEFYDCYALSANMNFGIIACESILYAEYFINSEELDDIRKKWAKIGVNLDELKCYRINTNSTNSVFNIFALGFRVIDI